MSTKGPQKRSSQRSPSKPQLDPRVQTEALRLAGGDKARIQAVSRTEAIVHNAQLDDEVIHYE